MKPAAPSKRVSHAMRVVRGLAKLYPDAKCSLDYHTPLELLVATMLSAQCTDVRVNQVTPTLFARYPDAKALAAADRTELERLIQSTGFFRNKAANILACARAIAERHDGAVPGSMAELVALAGVGRKTANVVLGNAFGVPGVVVDTHVQRLSRRLGLTKETAPEKIEQDLMMLIPKRHWVAFGHRMIQHGREVCTARKPNCSGCALATFCPKIGVD